MRRIIIILVSLSISLGVSADEPEEILHPTTNNAATITLCTENTVARSSSTTAGGGRICRVSWDW